MCFLWPAHLRNGQSDNPQLGQQRQACNTLTVTQVQYASLLKKTNFEIHDLQQ